MEDSRPIFSFKRFSYNENALYSKAGKKIDLVTRLSCAVICNFHNVLLSAFRALCAEGCFSKECVAGAQLILYVAICVLSCCRMRATCACLCLPGCEIAVRI